MCFVTQEYKIYNMVFNFVYKYLDIKIKQQYTAVLNKLYYYYINLHGIVTTVLPTSLVTQDYKHPDRRYWFPPPPPTKKKSMFDPVRFSKSTEGTKQFRKDPRLSYIISPSQQSLRSLSSYLRCNEVRLLGLRCRQKVAKLLRCFEKVIFMIVKE